MKCFVIMPYGNLLGDAAKKRELDLLYEELIRPAVESVELPGKVGCFVGCHRADKEPRPGEIVTHIIENLVLSEIAIADLSGKNSNVFYELGVRHAVSDNTILIARNEDDLPVDIRGQRYFIYQDTFQGGLQLRTYLIEAVRQIVRAPAKLDNPVRRFLTENAKGKPATLESSPQPALAEKLLQEVFILKKELRSQTQHVERIMAALPPVGGRESTTPAPAVQLEGIWVIEETGGWVCFHAKNGLLLAPYICTKKNVATPDSHFCGFRPVGKSLLARFEWFNGFFRGYALFEQKSENQLRVCWWSADWLDENPDSLQFGTDTSEWTLTKVRDEITPSWAQNYFEKPPTPGTGLRYGA